MRAKRANTGKCLLAIVLGVLWGMQGLQRPALATVPCSGLGDSASACPGEEVVGTIVTYVTQVPGKRAPAARR